jgi:hypothetical protein
MAIQDIPHGGNVSYQRENRNVGDGVYGVIETEALVKPAMLWPGLNASFGVEVEETYEEIPYTPAHGSSILERVRSVRLGENLPFHLETHPQATMDFPLLEFITGSVTGFGDQPDSMSWMKELDSKYSVFTGVMFEDYKCEIPGIGVVKETISGFAGHRADIELLGPGGDAVVSEATENTSNPRVWSDIDTIKLGTNGTEDITECISDISFGFTNEITKRTHPESPLSTKICGIRVVARKMFVSLKLTLVDQTFIDIVTGSAKQKLKIVMGTSTPNIFTITLGGLYWPKYIAKVEPRELAGDTITCVVDQPTCVYGFT